MIVRPDLLGQESIMPRFNSPTASELEELDRFYREGGLQAMASPHVHYDDPRCPYPGCNRTMEWIDFKLELHGDPDGIYKPLVRSWWQGPGFAGRCPGCRGWIRFTTLRKEAITDAEAARLPQLPDDWQAVAQIA
jgi:hypothetical protein